MPPSLLDTFYNEISSTYTQDNQWSFSSIVRINPAHAIFHGHFKQVPITPGVCMIEMIKEIVSEKLRLELFLEEGNNIKFLAMVNPLENPQLTITFELSKDAHYLSCNATCSAGAKVCVKFKGKFRLHSPGLNH